MKQRGPSGGKGLVEDGFEEPTAFGLVGGELRFEPVAQGHQLLHLCHDAVLFGEGREGNWYPSKISKTDSN